MAHHLTLLGGATVTPSGSSLPADRRGCLLALLAVEGGWVDRGRLALLFWPEADESTAKLNLRQLLARVRRLEPQPPLEATVAAVRWRVETDVADFRRALADGDTARTVALYGGPLLDGFGVHDVGGFDAWLEAERGRLHGAFHGACMREAKEATSGGRFDAAAELLARLIAHDPLAEDVLEAYVRALHLGGRRDAALHAYERFAAELDSELGLEPLAATQALLAQVRRGDGVALPLPPRSPTGPASPVGRWRPARLVARDAERHAALSASTAAVVLVGEPGIGKSALLRELWPDALAAGAREGLQQLPYHPFADVVGSRPELAAATGRYLEDLARLVPEVAPDTTPAPLDPGAARARLAQALSAFVAAGGGTLVVDDLQWADPATLEVLIYLAQAGRRVVGAYRTGEVTPELRAMLRALRSARALTEVPVGPISAAAVQALLADLMGRSDGPPAFAARLHHRSGGNPLFVLETLKALFEAGVLRADAGGWHTDVDAVTRDYAELDLPPVVSEVIDRRVGHLQERTVRVLEALALAQAKVGARLLARVTGLSADAVAAALDEAEGAGFLETAAAPGAEPRFRHDLLRHAVDGRLAPARRRRLHAMLAGSLADDANPGIVAAHWWHAGEPRRARMAWEAEAAALRARGLQTDAIAVLDGALGLLGAGVEAAWLRLSQAHAALESGSPDRAVAWVDDAEALAAPDGDGARSGGGTDALALRLKALLLRAAIHFHRGSVAEADALLAGAHGWAELVDDDDLHYDYVLQRSRVAKETLRFEAAIALLEPAVAELRRRRPDLRLVQFVSSLAALYDDTDRSEAALPLHRECLALARALGSRYYQVEVSINLLFCTAALGRYDEAADWAEEALTLGEYDNVPVLRTNLAANYFQAERYEAALRHYRLLGDLDVQPHLQVIALARSAECCAALGRRGEIGPLLDRALDRLPRTDVAVALGAAAIAVLRFGDDAQVARLWAVVPGLDPGRLPPHQRARLAAAVAARG